MIFQLLRFRLLVATASAQDRPKIEIVPNIPHGSRVWSVAFSPDGTRALSGSEDKTIKLWDIATGQLLRTFEGHTGNVHSVAFSPDGNRAVSGSSDSTIRIWNLAAGELLATLFGSANGEWLVLTPQGFFAGSVRGADEMVHVVRGLEAFSVQQFWEHLYRPDLVEQLLKGDPERRYKDAAFKLNLQKILDSGAAPQIGLPEKKTERAGDSVRVTVRINDTGGGIGTKVVWRVNGKTRGTEQSQRASSTKPGCGYRLVTETLRIDPRRTNVIEVIAHNAAGLLATEPFRITIDPLGGVSAAPRPRMFGIAVGVSDYVKADWKLQLAAKDAQAFAQTLTAVASGSGLYDEVKIKIVPQEQATRAGIAAAFDEIKGEVRPNDVFVLFVAGHGRTVEATGTYYFLPRDLTFEGGRSVEDGIGQDTWQAWLKQIAADKSILVFDTCESAAAIGLSTRGVSERETAIDRLSLATGQSIITAARQAAYEGYQGHGVLTYAILDALTEKAGGKGREVDIYQLAAQVDRTVPEISHSLFGVYQRPHNKIEGNFPIGVTQAALTPPDSEADIPAQPTHVVIRAERVRQRAAAGAPGERKLAPGSQVRVVKFVDDWAMIARDGQRWDTFRQTRSRSCSETGELRPTPASCRWARN